MTHSAPELLLEQAGYALQEKAWTPDMFRDFAVSVKREADKLNDPKRMIYNIYPNGNYGEASISTYLPSAKNEDLVVKFTTDATVLDDDGAVGLGSTISLTMSPKQIQGLAAFLMKIAARIDDLPAE